MGALRDCREAMIFLGWPEGDQCLTCWMRTKERANRLLPCPYKRRG